MEYSIQTQYNYHHVSSGNVAPVFNAGDERNVVNVITAVVGTPQHPTLRYETQSSTNEHILDRRVSCAMSAATGCMHELPLPAVTGSVACARSANQECRDMGAGILSQTVESNTGHQQMLPAGVCKWPVATFGSGACNGQSAGSVDVAQMSCTSIDLAAGCAWSESAKLFRPLTELHFKDWFSSNEGNNGVENEFIALCNEPDGSSWSRALPYIRLWNNLTEDERMSMITDQSFIPMHYFDVSFWDLIKPWQELTPEQHQSLAVQGFCMKHKINPQTWAVLVKSNGKPATFLPAHEHTPLVRDRAGAKYRAITMYCVNKWKRQVKSHVTGQTRWLFAQRHKLNPKLFEVLVTSTGELSHKGEFRRQQYMKTGESYIAPELLGDNPLGRARITGQHIGIWNKSRNVRDYGLMEYIKSRVPPECAVNRYAVEFWRKKTSHDLEIFVLQHSLKINQWKDIVAKMAEWDLLDQDAREAFVIREFASHHALDHFAWKTLVQTNDEAIRSWNQQRKMQLGKGRVAANDKVLSLQTIAPSRSASKRSDDLTARSASWP